MALSRQVIDFVRLDLGNNADQTGRVRHIPPMEVYQTFLLHVAYPFVQIQVLDPACIERGTTTKDAMDFITLLYEEFCEKGAILTGNAGNQCCFHI